MKLIFLVIVLLAVIGTKQNSFGRTQHTTAETHQVFENSWVGTSGSACDQACNRRGFKVCGRAKKECCRQDCSQKFWGVFEYCEDSSIVQDLQCSVIQSITGKYWNGDACDNACRSAGGQVCGKSNKQCCETGCDSGVIAETCKDSKPKEFNCTSFN